MNSVPNLSKFFHGNENTLKLIYYKKIKKAQTQIEIKSMQIKKLYHFLI